MTIEEFVKKIKEDDLDDNKLCDEYGHALATIATEINAAKQFGEPISVKQLRTRLLQTYNLFGDKILDSLTEGARKLIGK